MTKDQYINILPEVDVPGHSLAAIASYPELSCTPGADKYKVNSGEKFMVWPPKGHFYGLLDNTLCPANEKVYEFGAALGAICGDADLQLEALRPCRVESVGIAREMIDKGLVSVICDQDLSGVFIEATVSNHNHSVLCRITGSHGTTSSALWPATSAPATQAWMRSP